MKDKQYADRDIENLDSEGGYYSRHVSAMTGENLSSKSQIAAELGYRDSMIAELLDALQYGQTMNLADMLDWVADRLVYVHRENENVDFVISLRERASLVRAAINKALGETK